VPVAFSGGQSFGSAVSVRVEALLLSRWFISVASFCFVSFAIAEATSQDAPPELTMIALSAKSNTTSNDDLVSIAVAPKCKPLRARSEGKISKICLIIIGD
jgi:hypothetical protein